MGRSRDVAICLASCVFSHSAAARPPMAGAAPAAMKAQPAPAAQPFGSTKAEEAGAVHRRALLIGINDYRFLPDLRGAGNDLGGMRDLLVDGFGFDAANIRILRDEAANRSGILDAFDALLASTNPSTTVVVYFTGHGSQLADASPIDEVDGLDESIVPHDSGRDPHPNWDISDDTLDAFLRALSKRSRRVIAIIDACHSGTVTRGLTARSIAADHRPRPQFPLRPWMLSPRRPDGDGFTSATAPYIALVASRSRELAYERDFDGRPFGVFTWYLVRALRRAQAADEPVTYRDVMDVVRRQVRRAVRRQHPSAAGAPIDSVVLGAEYRPVEPYAEAEPREGRRIVIGVGRVHGAVVGRRYEVYPPMTKTFVPGRGKMARLTTVGATRSTAMLIRPTARIAVGARAVERLAPGAPPTVPRISGYISYWTRWFALRALDSGRACDDRADLQVAMTLTAPDDRSLAPGEQFEVVLENRARRRRLYVHLLAFTGDGSIAVVFPRRRAAEPMAPGRTLRRTLRAVLPPGFDEVGVTLKLIVTTKGTDFHTLVQDGITAPDGVSRGPPWQSLSATDLWCTTVAEVAIRR